MNPKIEPGGRGRIQYLLRCAFKAAREADRVEAMHYWRLAISEGYEVKSHTERELRITINQSEKASLDPEPPTSADDEVIGALTKFRNGLRDRTRKLS